MDKKYTFATILAILGLIIGVMDWIGLRPRIGYRTRQEPSPELRVSSETQQELRTELTPESRPEPRIKPWTERNVSFRSRSRTLSEADVRNMLIRRDFFDNRWNKTGDFENDFVDNGDGTVTDRMTGLMWQQSGSDDSMIYKRAQIYIDRLNRKQFASYSDWRLPTIEDLMSLMESREVHSRYIDPIFDKTQWWCWSADKRPSGGMWVAYFNSGMTGWSNIGCFYVRGARSCQYSVNRKTP